MPAEPETVMMFLAEHASMKQGVALATMRGWLSAINRVHLEAGERSPAEDPGMTLFLRGLHRSMPPRPNPDPVKALRISDLRVICRDLARAAADPVSIRDQALLTLYGNGLSSAELSHLRWEDVQIHDNRLQLRTRLKVAAPPTVRSIASSRRTNEVSAAQVLSSWQEVIGDTHDQCFVRISASLGARQAALHASDIDRILRTRLDSLGDGEEISPITAAGLLGGGPSADLRDRAMLLLGFAGAFRRVEVTRLRWSDLRQTPDGLVVRVRHSKTDPLRQGADVGIPYGRSELTCPVRALQAWRARVETQQGESFEPDGPCFVRVGRAGRIGREPLTGEALTRMLVRRAQRAGLLGRYGGRSLRAGFISTAADLDIPLDLIARQSRHATLDSLARYIRADDPFRRNASARLGM